MSLGSDHPGGQGERSSLITGVRVLRERGWVIVAALIVCLVVAFGLAKSSTKQYTATATLLVQNSNVSALVDPSQAQTQLDPARESADVLSLLESPAVAQRVQSQLHVNESLSDLENAVVATGNPNDDLISVAATDSDPRFAARLANGFATALVDLLTASAQNQVSNGEAQISAELASLPATDTAEAATLRQALSQIVALRAVTNGNVEVWDTAQPPSSPSSPNVKKDVALGAVVGIVLGLTLAFLLDLFDGRIKTAIELEELYGLPTLATIPLQRRPLTAARVQHDELSVFQILRGGLGFISLRREVRVVLVTSAVPGEGKTHVATGLALALAAAKKRVILVEADVHRPAAGKFLGATSGQRGLMNALVNSTDLDELVQTVPDRPLLSVLPSGPHTPNSAELLRLPAMSDIISDLAVDYDFVILDGPPLLPVADAQVLLDSPMIDGVIVVARPNLTTRDQIRGVLTILQRHPAAGASLVVNGSGENRHMYYYPAAGNGAPAERGRFARLIGSR